MTAPVKAGDQFVVEHDCWEGPPPRLVRHSTPVLVDRVVTQSTPGTWRVESKRCDGSWLHVIVDKDGERVAGGLS